MIAPAVSGSVGPRALPLDDARHGRQRKRTPTDADKVYTFIYARNH